MKKQIKATLVPLPCPFCGAVPSVHPKNWRVEGDAWGAVECHNKACAAKPYVRSDYEVDEDRGSGAFKDRAIELWNRRAAP